MRESALSVYPFSLIHRRLFLVLYSNVNLLIFLLFSSLGSSCQTGKMAALLNSIFFVFKISFLPKYRVIYYDYNIIVKLCSVVRDLRA